MARRKFEEDVVEETTTETTETTETVEESPDYHEQFVSILVDMGLSAEQAEAVHSMAMDLINSGEGETTETTEEVTEEQKVEARRARRMGSKRRGYSRRRGMSEDRPRGRRMEMSQVERMERRMRRLARQNRELREELGRMGARPAARPLSNRPVRNEATQQNLGGLAKSTQQALDMINKFK
jgi:hypothetical protein